MTPCPDRHPHTAARRWSVLASLVVLHVLCTTLLCASASWALPAQPRAAAAAPSQAAAPPLDFPRPNLDGLEDEIATQIRTAQSAIEEVQKQYGKASVARAIGTLGQLYHAYGLVGAAMSCYQTAATNTADLQWSYYLAHVLRDNGQFAASNEQLDEIVRRGGDSLVEVLYYLGANHLELGDLDAAEQSFRKGLEQRADEASLLAGLGEVALARGDAQQAIEQLQRALALQPAANRLHYPLAQAYQSLGDREAARSHFERFGSVGVRPVDPLLDDLDDLRVGSTPHVLRGRIAFGAGRFDEAVEAFRDALEARPDDVGHHVNLATALERAGRRAEAIATYEKAVEIDPDAQTALYNLGVLQRLEGQLGAAIRSLSRAVELNGDDLSALRELATAQRAGGDLAGAARNFNAVRSRDSLDEAAWFGEATTLVDLGQYAAARSVLEAALENVTRSLRLYTGLARLLQGSPDESVRDPRRAAELWKQIYEVQSTADHALSYAQALVAIGNCSAAGEIVTKVLTADGMEQVYSQQQLQQMTAWRDQLASGEACRASGG